jgi:hypothetical protein
MIRAPQPNAGATELTLIVEFASDADDGLLRVLCTLHRRRCRVTAAEFGGDRTPGRLELQIQAPAAHAARVAHWLTSLIDVRHVQTMATAPPQIGSSRGSRASHRLGQARSVG